MPPKRREKEAEGGKPVKTEQNGDHQQFLHAFEKPTQIYRYLRTRSMVKPLFLYRNLSYMKHRMSRKKKPGKRFSVDSILETLIEKQKHVEIKNSGYLTLTYLGFYNKSNPTQKEPVKLETLLLKVCHKRRKEAACPVMKDEDESVMRPETPPDDFSGDQDCKVSLGTSYVAYNPSEASPPPKVPTVSIPSESFFYSGPKVKSSTILLRIITNSEHVISINSDSESEPLPKKMKYCKSDDEKTTEFGMDLVVYDKHHRCHLREGQYEFLLSEVQRGKERTTISTSFSTWEDIGEEKQMSKQHFSSFENLSNGPTLKFLLQWSQEPVTPIIDRPLPIKPTEDKFGLDNNNEREVAQQKETHSVFYQFLYNSNSKQQTEASNDMHCPWCWLDCKSLYSLLKHLKLCHARFNFSYVPVQGGVRIDVSLNEGYDGSYYGPPANTPRGGAPNKRTPLSHVIVCHPKRPNVNALSEFIDLEENEFDNQRPYITGHNRLYHHTTTCLPIYPKEMDIDSEDETDPRWLQKKTMMMIDEFTDVNEGEKELMKMWNLHIMRHGFVGDCQIPLACSMFLEERGKELLKKNLYRNFVLHMSSLFDFGLVSPVTVFHIMQKLQDMIQSDDSINKQLQESWQTQREHWDSTDQKPCVDGFDGISSPLLGLPPGVGDSGQRRKPSSEKKPTPKKPQNGDKRRQTEARRRLSLPDKPELRRKVLKEASASPLRRRSFTSDGLAKKATDNGA